LICNTLDEKKDLIREAVEFHLEGMRTHADPIPAPSKLQTVAAAPKVTLDAISQNWDNEYGPITKRFR
jgi:hypothetical protein